MQRGKLYVAIECTNCGRHGEGVPATNGAIRCSNCGQFGSEAKHYCVEHDVDYKDIYPNDTHCPPCREEQRQREMIAERATRDPQLEPY